ncbi:hypothetical protein NXC14_PA00032 (plasmid) [Rhizobium sp. NXC14]|nr:hypothetical protein NXC14_PA00032 [Rhizobium sp. NXC14]
MPFLGIHPDWGFFAAFIFGALMIAAFAWQRFKQRSSEPNELDYAVIRKLAPTQLRESKAMRQAYFYYAGIMVAIYTAFAFFGGLILRIVTYIPMAGLQADVDQTSLTGPSWPLYLALGMAGFVPALKPVEVVETWLRRKVHAWAGVPIKLKDRTRRFLLALDRSVQPSLELALQARKARWDARSSVIAMGSTGSDRKQEGSKERTKISKANVASDNDKIRQKVDKVPDWMVSLLEKVGSYAGLVRKWIELEVMVQAIRDPGSWPETHILDEIQPLAREQRTIAESTMVALEDLMVTDYPKEIEVTQLKESERQASISRRRRQVETMLFDTVARLERSRLELAAILCVYAERSPFVDNRPITADRLRLNTLDHTLRSAVEELLPRERQPATILWVLVSLAAVFALYAVMTTTHLHPLLSPVKSTNVTILTTAALETLQVAAFLWLPLLGVMSLRQHFIDSDHRGRLRKLEVWNETSQQMICHLLIALLVAASGLALLAMFWTALISENTARFIYILVTGPQPALALMLPKCVCSAIFAFLLVRALDGPDRSPQYALLIAIGSASFVTVAFFALTFVGMVSFHDLNSESWADLYYQFGFTDFIACFFIVFVAICTAAWPSAPRESQQRSTGLATSGVVTYCMCILTLAMVGSPAVAEEQDAQHHLKPTVRIGFRRDAEPFSYEAGPSSVRRYRGYVADLCYSIFDAHYRIDEVPVTTENRFDSFRNGHPADRPTTSVDMLCDPTTLRFWRKPGDEEIDGIFSPIVFVSGVSYLLRRPEPGWRKIDFAYVRDTTAVDVAIEACKVDLFGMFPTDQRCVPAPQSRCPMINSTAEKDAPIFRFCEFEDYDSLTQWFCGPESHRWLVFFGDREIIQAKLESFYNAGRCDKNNIEKEASFYTYEPYALLIAPGPREAELAAFVQRGLYDFFSHRAKAISLFRAYFPDVQMSPMMANLFLLNGVDKPVYDTVPSYLFDTTDRATFPRTSESQPGH